MADGVKTVCAFCGAAVRRCVENGPRLGDVRIFWRDQDNHPRCRTQASGVFRRHSGLDFTRPEVIEEWLTS